MLGFLQAIRTLQLELGLQSLQLTKLTLEIVLTLQPQPARLTAPLVARLSDMPAS